MGGPQWWSISVGFQLLLLRFKQIQRDDLSAASFLTAIPMSFPSVSAQSRKLHWMCKKSSASNPIGICLLESDIIMFSLYHYYLPFGKSLVLHLKKLPKLNPNHPRMLCTKFGWNWPNWLWRRRRKVKSLQRTMDKLWSEKLTWAFGSGELKRVWK